MGLIAFCRQGERLGPTPAAELPGCLIHSAKAPRELWVSIPCAHLEVSQPLCVEQAFRNTESILLPIKLHKHHDQASGLWAFLHNVRDTQNTFPCTYMCGFLMLIEILTGVCLSS